jgi:hypothetical protein
MVKTLSLYLFALAVLNIPFLRAAHKKVNKLPSSDVIYNDRASAPGVDPPKSAGLRIYSVTSDGKSHTIHGFNKSGFTLALASGDQIVRGVETSFHSSVTFADQFPDGAKTVGKVTGKSNVWVARSPNRNYSLTSWSRRTIPPALPKDGGSVRILPNQWNEGAAALLLNFSTSEDGTSFLVVADESVAAKDKADKRDMLAKTAADEYLKAIQSQDLDAVMKMVDVPFFVPRSKENIKDRESLRSEMELLVKRDQRGVKVKVEAIYSVANFVEKFKLGAGVRDRMKEVAEAADRVVVYTLITEPKRDDRAAVLVRIRDGKAKVVGNNPTR